jgi:hypothetical protein
MDLVGVSRQNLLDFFCVRSSRFLKTPATGYIQMDLIAMILWNLQPLVNSNNNDRGA